jgi:hypothetical protein
MALLEHESLDEKEILRVVGFDAHGVPSVNGHGQPAPAETAPAPTVGAVRMGE